MMTRFGLFAHLVMFSCSLVASASQPGAPATPGEKPVTGGLNVATLAAVEKPDAIARRLVRAQADADIKTALINLLAQKKKILEWETEITTMSEHIATKFTSYLALVDHFRTQFELTDRVFPNESKEATDATVKFPREWKVLRESIRLVETEVDRPLKYRADNEEKEAIAKWLKDKQPMSTKHVLNASPAVNPDQKILALDRRKAAIEALQDLNLGEVKAGATKLGAAITPLKEGEIASPQGASPQYHEALERLQTTGQPKPK